MENDGLARFARITMNMQIIQSGSGSITPRGETRPENSWVKRTGVASVIMNAHHQLNKRTKVVSWGISWVCGITSKSLTPWPMNGWREPNLSDQISLDKWSSCCWKSDFLHEHRSLGACYPTGNVPMPGLLWSWLCWVVMYPRKCYQLSFMCILFLIWIKN